MNVSPFFERQLASTAEGFVWAVQQVPPARRLQAPPAPEWLGTWHVPRHVYHLLVYEREIALPSMRQWLGGPQLDLSGFPAEDVMWAEEGEGMALDSLVEQFQVVRVGQIALLSHFGDGDWEATRETIWGPVSLQWVVSKTFQHTAEHTHDVMRLVLFWDRALAPRRPSRQAPPE